MLWHLKIYMEQYEKIVNNIQKHIPYKNCLFYEII